jgi:hypothetical protein
MHWVIFAGTLQLESGAGKFCPSTAYRASTLQIRTAGTAKPVTPLILKRASGYFWAVTFVSASYCAWHAGLAWDFFACRHAATLAILVSDPRHSLNASPLHADCSAADGLKPANAALGNAKRAQPIAAIVVIRILFMT